MCYSGCQHENFSGDCRRGAHPLDERCHCYDDDEAKEAYDFENSLADLDEIANYNKLRSIKEGA